MASWSQIKDAVEKNGNLKTFTMEQLREAHGTARLGVQVRAQISRALAGLGLGHVPEELPSYQHEEVRLYKNGTPVGELIATVLRPGRHNDSRLSAQALAAPKRPVARAKPLQLPEKLIVKLYRQGWTVSAIAQKVGTGERPDGSGHPRINRIRRLLMNAGVYGRPGQVKKAPVRGMAAKPSDALKNGLLDEMLGIKARDALTGKFDACIVKRPLPQGKPKARAARAGR